jgi:hypothetical protein
MDARDKERIAARDLSRQWVISLTAVYSAHRTICIKCYDTPESSQVKVKVKITLRLTVSQSVSLGVELHLGLMTRYLLLFVSYGLVFVGRSLWREDGSVFV